jgi:diaminopimelate epimerase
VSLAFTKMQACGNDFIIVDDRAGQWDGHESALARRVCHRHFGIGADGLLLLRRGSRPDRFAMRFLNADGLVGEMCGNGARCLGAYLHRAQLVDEALVLETGAGPVHVDLSDMPTIRLTLGAMTTLRSALSVSFAGAEYRFDELEVGPPHVVCLMPSVDALAALDLHSLGRFVRHHPLFQPRGCNVNMAALADDGSLHVRTYERGVEEETLGCGTGAVASAAVARTRLGTPDQVRVVTRSGDELEIGLNPSRLPTLTGSARFVADGALHESVLEGLSWRGPGVKE